MSTKCLTCGDVFVCKCDKAAHDIMESAQHSLQQLKAEIAAVVSDMECCQPSLYPVYWSEYVNKLRQLSAV
jgi:hypothetical protein